MEVFINGGTPKWLVYDGKSHENLDDDWGYLYSRKAPKDFRLGSCKAQISHAKREVKPNAKSNESMVHLKETSEIYLEMDQLSSGDTGSIWFLHQTFHLENPEITRLLHKSPSSIFRAQATNTPAKGVFTTHMLQHKRCSPLAWWLSKRAAKHKQAQQRFDSGLLLSELHLQIIAKMAHTKLDSMYM